MIKLYLTASQYQQIFFALNSRERKLREMGNEYPRDEYWKEELCKILSTLEYVKSVGMEENDVWNKRSSR